MPISADQIYTASIAPWKKRLRDGVLDQNVLDGKLLTQTPIIVASNICPAIPSLPPLTHS